MKKILSPKLPAALEVVDFTTLEDNEAYQVELKNQEIYLEDRQLFSGCRLQNINFELEVTADLEFTDCIFEKCDFSNLVFSKFGFYRCIFKDCKLLGTEFTNAFLQDVQFQDCLLNYVNFSSARLKMCFLQTT